MEDEVYTTPELEEWGTVADATQTQIPGTRPAEDDDDDDDDE